MVTLAATPSDSPMAPKPSSAFTSHRGSLRRALPECPDTQLQGPASGSQEGKDAEAVDHTPGCWATGTPAASEYTEWGLAVLALPHESHHFPSLPGLCHSFCWIRDVPDTGWLSKSLPGAAVVSRAQRNLASLELRKKTKEQLFPAGQANKTVVEEKNN